MPHYIAIDPSRPLNNLRSSTLKNNVENSEIDPTISDFFNDKTRSKTEVYQRSNYTNYEDLPENNRRNIRNLLDSTANRTNKYNVYNNKYIAGFPQILNYFFCPQRLTTVFNYGKYQNSRYFTGNGFPFVPSSSIVNQLNLDAFSCSSGGGGGGGGDDDIPIIIDDEIDLPTPYCLIEECELIPIPPLKSPIYGYAFYVETQRPLSIPDIEGTILPSCWDGHICNQTLFAPKIQLSNNTTLSANRNVSMNNAGGQYSNTQIPVPGFVPQQPYPALVQSIANGPFPFLLGYAPFERSDTFTIDFDPLVHDLTDARLYFDCLIEEAPFCHTNKTFVVLVAETADTNEKMIIFQSCVLPGPTACKFLGTVSCGTVEGPCDSPDITPEAYYDCKLYTPSAANDTLSIYNTWTGTPDTTIDLSSVGDDPWGVIVNTDLNKVYVSDFYSNKIAVIDGDTNAILTTINTATNGGFNPNSMVIYNDKLYVITQSSKILVYDCSDDSYINQISIGANGCDLAIDPVTGVGFSCNRTAYSVSVFNADTYSIIATVDYTTTPGTYTGSPPVINPGQPFAVKIDTVTHNAYVLAAITNRVNVIDPSGNVVETILLDPGVKDIAIDSDNRRRAYVVNTNAPPAVQIIDLDTNTVTDTIEIPGGADDMELHNLTNRLYINSGSNIYAFSTISNSIVKTIDNTVSGKQLAVGVCTLVETCS